MMGWGRYLLLGDLGQQLDLSDLSSELNRLRDEVRRSRPASTDLPHDLRRLEAENDELRLYLAALVRILISKGVMSAQEMQNVVAAIDREDGFADGRFTGDIA